MGTKLRNSEQHRSIYLIMIDYHSASTGCPYRSVGAGSFHATRGQDRSADLTRCDSMGIQGDGNKAMFTTRLTVPPSGSSLSVGLSFHGSKWIHRVLERWVRRGFEERDPRRPVVGFGLRPDTSVKDKLHLDTLIQSDGV
jgi:hypothetical protein